MFRIIFVLLFVMMFYVQNTTAQRIELGEEVIEYLASDQLEGRAPGTDGDKLARKFLSQKFYDMWMGRFSFGYEQSFSFLVDVTIDSKTALKMFDNEALINVDFKPFIYGSEGAVESTIIFAGNSIEKSEIDISQKIALVYYEVDDDQLPNSRAIINDIIAARDKHAAAMVFAVQKDFGDGLEFFPFEYNRSVVNLGLPVIQITRKYLQELLAKSGMSISKISRRTPQKVNSKLGEPSVSISIVFNRIQTETTNIAGYIEGVNSNEWVVLGAHYDHLGYGGLGSGSRTPENRAIHNGADDNASGAAMVLMLAEYYKKHKPQSNMAFVLFGAEEVGLIGSKYFVEHLPFPVEKVKAMVNFDMVGRMKDSALGISGVKSANEFESILSTWQGNPIKLSLGGNGLSGSDQASFYTENIPVLFFNTGLHADYHTPNDDVEFINFDGMALIADLSVKLVDSLLNAKTEITFSKTETSDHQRHYKTSMKVKLGVMPDVAGVVRNGMGIDGVTNGGIAQKAGIVKGDVIIEINGKSVTNIYDYMKRLGELEPGELVKIKLKRNNDEILLDVQL